MEQKRKGFTLVELMVAALLAGIALVIALPLILIGRNTDVRTEKKEAIALAGDAVYEYIADEIKFAGRLYIGDADGKRPAEGKWKSITAGKASPDDTYSRLLYSTAREISGAEPAATQMPLYDEGYQEKTELVIEAAAAGRNQLQLTVKLMDGEQALYEKSSVLSLLNLTLNATSQIEGYLGGTVTTAERKEKAGNGGTVPAVDSKTVQNERTGALPGQLVLWYQSSRETANPFLGDIIEGVNPGDLGFETGDPVVSLADPQYVKVNSTIEIQFKAQAGSGETIPADGYVWEITGNEAEGSGGYYIDGPKWDEDKKSWILTGLHVTPDEEKVSLSLTVNFADKENGGIIGDMTDTCSVIVYEGEKPENRPVDGFTILPGGSEELEDEYAKHPEYPIWIKNGEGRMLWLAALDKEKAIVPYSPKNWISLNDGKSYRGFYFPLMATSPNLRADGKASLDGENDGRNTIVEEDGTERNVVAMTAKGMETEPVNFRDNTYSLSFGSDHTAYRPNGKENSVYVSRTLNIYDGKGVWGYRTDTDGMDYKEVKEEDSPQIHVLSVNQYIDLSIDLKTQILLAGNVNRENEPEIDPNTVSWFLGRDSQPVLSGRDFCRFGIGDYDSGDIAAQLKEGENHIFVEFKDTSGFSYKEEITVNVPSEVAYVKMEQEKYTLACMNQLIDGVSSQALRFELYDENGLPVDGWRDNKIYSAEWLPLPTDSPVSLKMDSDGVQTARAEKPGTQTVTLIVKEGDREIFNEDGETCTFQVEVKPMELSLKLRYKQKTATGTETILSASIESGKEIPVFPENIGMLAGFDAELKLPAEVEKNLTEKGLWEKLGSNYPDWNKVNWKQNSEIFKTSQKNDNLFSIDSCVPNKAGSAKFSATALYDEGVSGLVSVVANGAQVADVEISNVEHDENRLVIRGENDKDEGAFYSIQLRAELYDGVGGAGRSCDGNVIWTVRQGKDLVDTEGGFWGVEVDSKDSRYFPVIRLKNGLTAADAGKSIVVRATSASSGKYAEYTVTLLPKFEITYPYSESFELVHMMDKKNAKDDISDTRTLETNRSASWTISPQNTFLKFTSNSEGVNEATVETQKIGTTSSEGTVTVTATDDLTGQTDSRKINIQFETIEEGSDKESGWSIHFNPNGYIYMDMGDPDKEIVITSGIGIKKDIFIKENSSSVAPNYKPDASKDEWWSISYGGTLSVEATTPGIRTFYARTLIFGVQSTEYAKVIVRGLKLPEAHSEDVSIKEYSMLRILESGDIESNNCIWESSNRNIATVDDNGMLTLLNPGKTIITVTGRANSNGKKYTAECEFTVKSDEWNAIKTVTNRWKDHSLPAVNLLAGSPTYESARIETRVNNGESKYDEWKYYTIISKTQGKNARDILYMNGDTAVADGEGEVSILAGAGAVTASAPLTAKVFELKNINISARNPEDPDKHIDSDILHFITDGPKELILTADFDWGSNLESAVPGEFKAYEWTVDEKSGQYVKLDPLADGTCRVEAIGMGVAVVTCHSLASPDIYETYVVIVSF